ncbi:MAG: glycosyltransferase [Caldilineaceae bacterium]
MMNARITRSPHVVWVSPVDPASTLDSATWLDTTEQLRQLGWKVTLIGQGGNGIQSVRGIEILCLPRPYLYLFGQVLYHWNVICFLLKTWNKIDIILFQHTSGFFLLPLRLLRSVRGQPYPLLVMDTRDIDEFQARKLKVRLRLWLHHLTFTLANNLADGQTSITTRLAALTGLAPKALLGVWPSGVKPDHFAQAGAQRQWPADGEPIQLIYVGILTQNRNLLPLCQAVVQANQEGMPFVFSMVGKGAFQETLAAFASESGGIVQVLPPVPHEQIPHLFAKAHVGVTSLPDQADLKYQASSPIKLFEYLAAGLPILSTSNVCHTDVVGTGEYAFWVDEICPEAFLAALRQLWHQRQRLPELGQHAAVAVEDWTWQAAAEKLSNALEEALKRSKGLSKNNLYKC